MPRAPKSTSKPATSAAKPARSAGKRKTHPSYAVMITKALYDHYSRDKKTGISPKAIATFITSTFSLPASFGKYLRAALKAGVAEERFRRAGKSLYRLSTKTRSQLEKKRKGKRTSSGKKRSGSSTKATAKKTTTKRTTKTGGEAKKRTPSSGKSAAAGRTKKKATATPRPKKTAAAAAAAGTKKRKATAAASAPSAAKPAKAGRKSKQTRGAAPANEETGAAAVNSESGEEVARVYGGRLPKYEYIWQFRENDGVFHNYDIAASDVCEEVYQDYLQNRGTTDVRAVKSGQWHYMVDFMALKQTNIDHPNHTVRDCRRIKWVNA